jgi:hypothetical protein
MDAGFMTNPRSAAMELNEILNDTAHRIIEHGTESAVDTLAAMAAATRGICPGAAAALVDDGGPEIARLRAFGIVHVAICNRLDDSERFALLAELTGTAPMALVA